MALRDTFAAVQAHIMRLEDPESAVSWLYWFARAECRRRGPVPPDEPPGYPGQPGDKARLIAWNTVLSLDAAELEALDLACRHDVKPELVLGLPAEQVQGLVDRARLSLERALSAEIVISRGIPDCPDRAEVMAGWAGAVTPEVRDRALRHAADCPACGPTRPRNVSPARVLAMLPWPTLSPPACDEVLRLLRDHRPQRRRRLPWVRVLLAGTVATAAAFGYVLVGTAGGSSAGPAATKGAPAITSAAPAITGAAPAVTKGAPAITSAPPGGSPAARPADIRRRAGTKRPGTHSPGPRPGLSGNRGEAVITNATRPLPAGSRPVGWAADPGHPGPSPSAALSPTAAASRP